MTQNKTSILYLHGFASSPNSRKARFFEERLSALGAEVRVPQMDEGDFFHLTLSRQRALIERLSKESPPDVLIGSSMGGYLSALYASEHTLKALILLAPAVDFAARWRERLGEEQLTRWRRDNSMEVFHFGQGKNAPISYDLMADAPNHEPWPGVSVPTLVFHGVKDEVVPQERVERWVSQNKTATLRLMNAGHELTEVLSEMLEEVRAFLGRLQLL
jgi:pimeloyl-ACP methyl ester carboxylesterase